MAKIKLVLLGIGIALVLVFFIGYGIDTFYKSPKWENFCNITKDYSMLNTQESCEMENGRWMPYAAPEKPLSTTDQLSCTKQSESEGTVILSCIKPAEEIPRGYCDAEFNCAQEFRDVDSMYNRNVFILCMIFGLAAVIAGTYLKLLSVSAGIMGGGFLAMFYGSMRYWSEMNEYFRFSILAIVLAVLIWVGYKKFKK
jgi:hypothetical protein